MRLSSTGFPDRYGSHRRQVGASDSTFERQVAGCERPRADDAAGSEVELDGLGQPCAVQI